MARALRAALASQGIYKLMQYALGGVALGGWQLVDLFLMGAIGVALLGLIFLKVVIILLGALLYALGPLMIGLVPTEGGVGVARAWASAAVALLTPTGVGHDPRGRSATGQRQLHRGAADRGTAIGTPGADGRIDMQPVNGTGYAGSGALTSTVGDLSRYLRALLDGRLLRQAQLRSMQTLTPAAFAPGPDPPPFSPSYWGLGLEGTTTRCGRIYGGTGAVLGYAANMTGTPGGHRIVTLAVNELQSLPGLVAVLQRQIPPLICSRVVRP